MLGDSSVCVGFGFHSSYPRDASPAFAQVKDLLRRHEIVVGNLECLLTPIGAGATRFRTDQMRGDPEYARDLRAAGFTALSVANNHAMQHGRAAFDATVASLEAAGIAIVGIKGADDWCAKPVIVRTRAGRRVGILGYCWRPRQYDSSVPPYAEGDIEQVERDVRRLRAVTDDVVVSLHWGEEFVARPSADEVAHARRIIDAGASVLAGHHPHVARTVERYEDGIICYSLGNLVTDMTWETKLREGLIMTCELTGGSPRAVRVFGTHVNRGYAPELTGERPASSPSETVALSAQEYRAAVRQTVARQRIASYLHAARNASRFPFPVFVTLVATTVRNKLLALSSAGRKPALRRPG